MARRQQAVRRGTNSPLGAACLLAYKSNSQPFIRLPKLTAAAVCVSCAQVGVLLVHVHVQFAGNLPSTIFDT